MEEVSILVVRAGGSEMRTPEDVALGDSVAAGKGSSHDAPQEAAKCDDPDPVVVVPFNKGARPSEWVNLQPRAIQAGVRLFLMGFPPAILSGRCAWPCSPKKPPMGLTRACTTALDSVK